MLARVTWVGERSVDPQGANKWHTEHGTLLSFVYAGTDVLAMIARDGRDGDGRGKIIAVGYRHVTVTTWFKWSSPPTHITGPANGVAHESQGRGLDQNGGTNG